MNYYISPNGNNSNEGTIANPWLTIQHGAEVAIAGDVVYVRAGIYHERVRCQNPGNENDPILISAYPGEYPIVDGQYVLPTGVDGADPFPPHLEFNYNGLVCLEGEYITFSDIEVRHSKGRGILLWPGHHNMAIHCLVHDCRCNSIWLIDSDDSVIDGCEAYHSNNFAPYIRDPQIGPVWPGAIVSQNSHRSIIKNCISHNNWGEGIQVLSSENARILNSISYDNMAPLIYGDHAFDLIVDGNNLYHTGDRNFLKYDGNPTSGISLADEAGQAGKLGSNYTITNNRVRGCGHALSWWNQGASGTGMRNSTIARNVFHDSIAGEGVITITNGAHQNNIIKSNIIVKGIGPLALIPDAGFACDYNVWSELPAINARGTHDIVGVPKEQDMDILIELQNLLSEIQAQLVAFHSESDAQAAKIVAATDAKAQADAQIFTYNQLVAGCQAMIDLLS